MVVSHPHATLKSEGYLDYYQNGVLKKSVKLRTDVYNQTTGIIAIMPDTFSTQ